MPPQTQRISKTTKTHTQTHTNTQQDLCVCVTWFRVVRHTGGLRQVVLQFSTGEMIDRCVCFINTWYK